jgi:THO complex subunit 4
MFKKRGRGGYGARRKGKTGGRTTPYKKGQNKNATVTVTNLDSQVTENDVKEIFQKIGRVVKTFLNFDSNGRSRGTGEIVFASRNLALKAVEEYNRAEVDGRPMYLKLVGGGTPKKASVKKSPVVKPKKKSTKKKKPQVQSKKKSKKKQPTKKKSKKKQPTKKKSKKKQSTKKNVASKKQAGKGKGRGKGRATKKRKPKPLTAEQLDKEMELYHKKGGGTTKTAEQLDREMELYHIRAGQPPPPKSEPVAMDEAEE